MVLHLSHTFAEGEKKTTTQALAPENPCPKELETLNPFSLKSDLLLLLPPWKPVAVSGALPLAVSELE